MGEHEFWTDQVNRIANDVRRWEQWAADPPHPSRLSQLAYDDQLCPAISTSGLGLLGITIAVDNMATLVDALQHSESTRPYGYFPLTRAAVFAAARSIWILSPQFRKDRVRRALWLEWESNRKYMGLVDSLKDPKTPEGQKTRENFATQLEARRAALVSEGEKLGVRLRAKGAPSDTSIMESATAWIDRHTEKTEFGSGNGMMILWRNHSGVAHGLPWVNVGRTEVLERLPHGGVTGRVASTAEDLGLAMGSAAIAIREAMRLRQRLLAPRTKV